MKNQGTHDFPEWIVLIISFLIVLAAFAVSAVTNLLEVKEVLIGLGIVAVAGMTGGLTTLYFARQPIGTLRQESNALIGFLEQFRKRSHSFEHYIEILKDAVRGTAGETLITYRELKRIESDVPAKAEIWIMTSALELEEEELKAIIRRNLKDKSVVYKYLLPRDQWLLRAKFRKLAGDWQEDCGLSDNELRKQLHCYLVPDHVVHLTVAIYDPLCTDHAPTVVVKLPTTRLYPESEYPLVLRVQQEPREAWLVFLNALRELMMCDSEAVCPNVSNWDYLERTA